MNKKIECTEVAIVDQEVIQIECPWCGQTFKAIISSYSPKTFLCKCGERLEVLFVAIRKPHPVSKDSLVLTSGDPKDPETLKPILSNTDIAIGRELKVRSEALAVMCEESCVGNPHVQDENGNWMTREQLVHRLRNSWAENMLRAGWSRIKVEALRELLG